MPEYRVDEDTAEVEFLRFGEEMDLDFDVELMDEEDRKSFEQQKTRVVKAIRVGSLVINDNGEPVFTPQKADGANPIVFKEPTGAAYMAMDRKKRTEDMAKFFSVMAETTGASAGLFSKMKGSDLKICMAVMALFLG